MKKSTGLILFLAVMLPFSLKAQKKWTLEDCIRYAWENNLTIKQQELGVKQSENVHFQSKMSFAPSVSARVSENVNWGQSVDLSTLTILNHVRSSNTGVGLYADMDIFTGFQKLNTVKQEQSRVNVAIQKYKSYAMTFP